MGFANSPDIFQQKMNYLFHGFEFICSYIYNLLVLKKGDWTEYVQKLELTLNKLMQKIIKYNIEKCFFWKPEIDYLSFWVTRYVVKLTNKKYKQ